ncbi:hypothetical protein ACFS32_21835 [Novosphingobium pokkalii]|uniref:hypothetical protein n=1 Tax=Novosphingobium pokkalii TaxID=1770194 RepID=UPI00363DF433
MARWRFPFRPRLAVYPTARAVLLLALTAPAGLLLATLAPQGWVVAPAAGGALIVLVLLDALMAGALRDVRLAVADDAEVGQPLRLALDASFAGLAGGRAGGAPLAALACDPRLADGGRVPLALAPSGEAGAWRGKPGWSLRAGGRRGSQRCGCAGAGRWAWAIARSRARWTRRCGSGPISPRCAARPCRSSCAMPRSAWWRGAFAAKAPSSRPWPITNRAWTAAASTGKARPATAACLPRNTRPSATTRSFSRSIAARR